MKLIFKGFLLGSILFLSAVACHSTAPEFTVDTAVLVSSVCGSYVLNIDTGVYRIFYSTGFGIVCSTFSETENNWVILSTFSVQASTYTNYDDYAVLNPAILKLNNTYYRMIYEGITTNPATAHYFLSAVSTDTINWFKEVNSNGISTIRYRNLKDSVTAYISSPEIIEVEQNKWRMYYTVSTTTSSESSSDDAIGSAVSTDDGYTWAKEDGLRVGKRAIRPDCVKLTDGKYRLYWIGSSASDKEPLNDAVFSGLSSDGLVSVKEDGTRLLRADGRTIDDTEIFRLADGYRWQGFYSVEASSIGVLELYKAVADTPLVTQISPAGGRNNQSVSVRITGEVFCSTSAVKLIFGTKEIVSSSVTRPSDIELKAVFDLTGQPVGQWSLQVTNQNGKYGRLDNCFLIQYPPGNMSLEDNLMRAWENKPTKVNFTIYGPGNVKIKIYTLEGKLVKNLTDEDFTAGSFTRQWDGTDEQSNKIASGVYIATFEGPETKARSKIAVVR